ncbi:MAG: N-acetyltransferase [Lachnospiraceae bacterium]|nr:N-acetyltransferase [Lachnospiraceae bacterium]
MTVRLATKNDVPEILWTFAYARDFMKKTDNPTQWGDDWPNEEIVLSDIEKKICYVITEENVALGGEEILGVFTMIYGKDIDPTYEKIEPVDEGEYQADGKWLSDEPYGVIHRLAGNGKAKGVGTTAINFALDNCNGHVRVDTHANNKVMQKVFLKNGFKLTGLISVGFGEDPWRYAYEYVEEN